MFDSIWTWVVFNAVLAGLPFFDLVILMKKDRALADALSSGREPPGDSSHTHRAAAAYWPVCPARPGPQAAPKEASPVNTPLRHAHQGFSSHSQEAGDEVDAAHHALLLSITGNRG